MLALYEPMDLQARKVDMVLASKRFPWLFLYFPYSESAIYHQHRTPTRLKKLDFVRTRIPTKCVLVIIIVSLTP